ncbi:MAG: hypothetical protein COA44_07300 [Arcobacter sp.]|nr:MAG: hypothetical protein COA44_07300 [Arcobacter sp.]
MQDLVKIYNDNTHLIEKFLISTLKRLHIQKVSEESYEELHKTFSSLELMYECNDDLVQASANFGKNIEDLEHIGKNRDYLININDIKDSYYVSEPYISSTTGSLCITVVHKYESGYIFLDFRLRVLLERFYLIESKTLFKEFTRISYACIGGGLLILGIFIAFYGFGSFALYLSSQEDMNLEVVFKPVIALTLGLAVFDLGKTIFEQEVLPRTLNISESFNPKSLVTFMSSIVIALLIEALLIVFKISINDYHDLPYAAMLIVSISILLFVFSRFMPMQSSKKEA